MFTIIFSALSPDCYFELTSVPTEGSMTPTPTAEFAANLTATLSLLFPPIWQQNRTAADWMTTDSLGSRAMRTATANSVTICEDL